MENRKPIICSMLDLDFYKLTMAQVAFKHFGSTQVKYAFRNRTEDVNIAEYIKEEELRYELESIQNLKFSDDEIEFLKESKFIKRGFFEENFLEFLKNLKLSGLTIRKNNQGYEVEVHGNWPDIILWETLILSVINELFYRSLMKKIDDGQTQYIYDEGRQRLIEKTKILKVNPHIKFTEFGTRRRFSKEWQKQVISTMLSYVPENIAGTSNTLLAKEFDLAPIGTFAHEMDMVFSGVFKDDIRGSHNKVLKYWWDQYGYENSIALTDTYGSNFFFEDMTYEQAKKWKGLRHDSGNPIVFGNKAIKFYKDNGIDPTKKLIVFSDGLDIDTIVKIANHFKNRINVIFGWGTNLTNDLGFRPLSLVVKVVESNGNGTVKLSDNLAKAIGKPEDIELFKNIFGHSVTLDEPCVY